MYRLEVLKYPLNQLKQLNSETLNAWPYFKFHLKSKIKVL